jgi:hypothetical protein
VSARPIRAERRSSRASFRCFVPCRAHTDVDLHVSGPTESTRSLRSQRIERRSVSCCDVASGVDWSLLNADWESPFPARRAGVQHRQAQSRVRRRLTERLAGALRTRNTGPDRSGRPMDHLSNRSGVRRRACRPVVLWSPADLAGRRTMKAVCLVATPQGHSLECLIGL